ncbi:MAG: MFS transporter [Chloroflexi bacterium]|nr:MAG: MFS transporter [Chloroflexota bacterium]
MAFLPRSRVFWAVAAGHMTNDFFMSTGPVLLAFLSLHLFPISNTQIGLAVSSRQLMGSFSQPFFGWLADKRGTRELGTLGVAWSVSFIMLAMALALTEHFWLMIIPYALSALGSGAFHPAGAMNAAEADHTRSASNLSIFFFAGQLGLALGPAVVGLLLDFTTTHHNIFTATLPALNGRVLEQGSIWPVFVLGLAAIPAVFFMGFSLPRAEPKPAVVAVEETTQVAKSSPFAGIVWKTFLIFALMVTIRSFAQPGIVPFIPVLFSGKGWTSAQFGLITSLFWLSSGIAGMVFGNLADRFDRRYVMAIGTIASAPMVFLLPITDGVTAFVVAIAAGGLSGGSHSIIVVMAQEIIPGKKGFASGAILGFIFGSGALGTFVIGLLSDAIGLTAAFEIVAGMLVVAALTALALPATLAFRPDVTLRRNEREAQAATVSSAAGR